jgi:hypothetical protein
MSDGHLRQEALALPVDERAALAKDLLLSLDGDPEPGAEQVYAEFVVTEKAWGHISRASKLSEHYGTQVVSLEDLPQVLEANGCYDPTSLNVGQGSP